MGQPKILRCRECGTEYQAENRYFCEACFGPLDVLYDYEHVSWRRDLFYERGKNYWRYHELLPVVNPSNIVSLEAGFTPLVEAEELGSRIGIKNLYIKNDTVNPTFSFKDRPAGVGVSKACEFGLKAVGCASTGNLASATAAHAAKAGIPCYVFVPAGLEKEKITQALIHLPTLVEVEGSYDDANRLAAEAADLYSLGIVNVNLRTYYVEGSKTLAFEIAEQLNWQTPDHIVIPVGSGAMLHAICKGLEELKSIGILKEVDVKITAAQPEACAPIVDAFKSSSNEVTPVENPQTLAKSLAIGDPGDGIYALRKIREYHGFAEAASDRETVEAIGLLARTEGIFSEPAGGVALAALKRLVEQGKIDRDERVVCLITGSGLKATDAVATILPKAYRVQPRVEQLAALISGG